MNNRWFQPMVIIEIINLKNWQIMFFKNKPSIETEFSEKLDKKNGI